MLQGILIVVAFLVVAALMMTKKIPTLLALPLMAVVICIIAGVPMFGKNADGAEIGWLTTVFEAGSELMLVVPSPTPLPLITRPLRSLEA